MTIGSFTYYQTSPDYVMFTCWNIDETSLGCHSVEPSKFRANVEALVKMGYINRTARKEWFDYRRRAWVEG